jgi:hypothetical protein
MKKEKIKPVSVRLKLPLTAEAKSELERFLKIIKEAFEADKKTEDERRKLHKRVAELRSEVDSLQTRFDKGDLEVLEKLTAKKAQHAMIYGKSMEPNKASDRDPWYGIMIAANDFLRDYFVTGMEDLRQEVIETLTPLFQSEKQAEQFVAQVPVIHAYQNWFNRTLITMSHQRAAVAKLVPVIENILAGKEFWSYSDSN